MTHRTLNLPSQSFLAFVFLGILTAILGLSVIPGVFIIDEVNYAYSVAALRHGEVEVPGVEKLPAQRSLLYFIPGAEALTLEPSRIVSNAPPLYAFLALPFAQAGGFVGLIWLNLLAYVVCAWLVFKYTLRFSSHPSEPWVAMMLFTLGSYTIEYAMGAWPHCLSAALCMGGFSCAAKGRLAASRAPLYFCCAGFLLGVAAGVRYPNVVFAAAVLFGIIVLSRHKISATLCFILGLIPPLLLSSFLNHLRQDSWNPFSKGATYTSLTLVHGFTAGNLMRALESSLRDFVSRVLDFSLQGDIPVGFQPNPASEAGAIFCMGVLKKAWVQSIPWVLLVMGILLLVVLSPRNWRKGEASREREKLAIAFIVFIMILLFTAAGASRIDGLGFNQRYFFDLLPFVSIVFAWTAGRRLWESPRSSGLGLLLGGILTALILKRTAGTFWRDGLLLYAPVILSISVLFFYGIRKKHLKWVFPLCASAAMAWGAVVHVRDDLQGSRKMRKFQAQRMEEATAVIPATEPAMVFAYHGLSLALGPLQLTRDLVIADPWIDNGESATPLIDVALQHNRRVFVVINEFHEPVLVRILGERQARWVHKGNLGILEILQPR
jgi:hypothetical protein